MKKPKAFQFQSCTRTKGWQLMAFKSFIISVIITGQVLAGLRNAGLALQLLHLCLVEHVTGIHLGRRPIIRVHHIIGTEWRLRGTWRSRKSASLLARERVLSRQTGRIHRALSLGLHLTGIERPHSLLQELIDC